MTRSSASPLCEKSITIIILFRRLRGVNYEDGMLPKELLAFSDPTNAGRSFAVSYIGREDFLVFKCIQSNQPVRDFLKEQEERDKQLL